MLYYTMFSNGITIEEMVTISPTELFQVIFEISLMLSYLKS